MSQDKSNKPRILACRDVASSRLFRIQAVDLQFSNGVLRTYERLRGSGRSAVMIVAVHQQQLYLVREYAVGTESYELGFAKGLIDPGETSEQAANRELREELGYRAQKLTKLKTVTLNPSYFGSSMDLWLAEGLVADPLEGDEPEPLELVTWPLTEIDELIALPEFCEARSLAALMLFQRLRAAEV